jgi:hypothetical protein
LICVRISKRRNNNYNFSNEQFSSVCALDKAYAGFKGAVKESAGEIFGDKKPGLKAKPTSNMQKAVGGLKDAVCKNRPLPSTEASHGIDPDYRCATAAVWRRRRIPWSQSRLLVIEGGPRDRARTGMTGPGSSPGF